MTTAITYSTLCDICGKQISLEQIRHVFGAPMMIPRQIGPLANQDVCDKCDEEVCIALADVYNGRRVTMINRSQMKKEMQGGKKTKGGAGSGGPLCKPGHAAKNVNLHKKMAMGAKGSK